VEDEISAVAAVDRLAALSRQAIRKQFEARFTARRMALDYLAGLPEPDGGRRAAYQAGEQRGIACS